MVEFYNPVSSLKEEKVVRTPFALKGKRVGLLSNSKPNVDLLYNYMAKGLLNQFQMSSTISLMKINAAQPAPTGILNKLSEETEVVINAIGD